MDTCMLFGLIFVVIFLTLGVLCFAYLQKG